MDMSSAFPNYMDGGERHNLSVNSIRTESNIDELRVTTWRLLCFIHSTTMNHAQRERSSALLTDLP